jgi:putative flippase GtrA
VNAAASAAPPEPGATSPGPAEANKIRLVEFLRFLATGSIAALSNMAAVWALQLVMPLLPAAILGYLVGMVIAFILFQRVMFNTPGLVLTRPILARRIFRFTIVNMLGLCLSVATTMALARAILPAIHWTLLPDRIANLVGVAVPAFSSYFGHKFWTYR